MSGSSAGSIVVGIDGSVSALHAARWAAEEAVHRRRNLRLVHAIDDVSLLYPGLLPMHDDLSYVLQTRGEGLLRAARDAVREVAPDLKPELGTSRSGPASTLLEMSKSASRLVLGTWALRRLGRVFLGSVSIALAAHASCPVALIRGHHADEPPPTEGPVVVGVDASPASEDAIAIAFEEASWRNAPLVAVHSWDDSFLASVLKERKWDFDLSVVEEHEREVLAQRLAGWQEKFPDVTVHRAVERGRPAERLLDAAEHARLIVVGSRGRGGFTGMLLGSTSQTIMSYAPCPVIVARQS